MIIKKQPYRLADSTVIAEKKKAAQLKNIKSRLSKLNLTNDELKSLFQTY